MDNVKNSGRERAGRGPRRPAPRRLVQLYSALLYNAHLKGWISGDIYRGNVKAACVPGLNCYSCPGAAAACPLGALQNALGSMGHRAGWYILGILLLYGVILGRTVCGWLCPVGLIQELLHKIPTPKIRKSRVTRILSWLKYGILAVFVLFIPLRAGLETGVSVPGFCKYICPAGTLAGAAGLLPSDPDLFGMLGWLFTRKWVIMLAIGLACIFCYRSFCRFICPLGAIYSLFSRFTVVGVRVDESRCNGCGACVRTCETDIRRVGDRECIHCAKCVDVCSRGAISLKAGKITLKGNETGAAPETVKKRRNAGRAAWAAALAVLCFALVWFNLPGGEEKEAPAPAETAVTYGAAPGDTLPDFTVACLDGTEFRLGDTRGKVVFINLWATYCGPCVRELPYFMELAEAHPDDTAVIAVHSSLIVEDPESFLRGQDFAPDGDAWAIAFANDPEDDPVWRAVDGSATLPQTIVLDREGKVVYNERGSVTPEMLEALYRKALGEEN